nr:unnamed protein product [Digitaria exilis]
MATSSTPSSLPCLVLDYGGGDQRATLFGVSDGVHRPCDADELHGKRAWPTSHGWVLTWDPATAAMSLWNARAPPDAAAAAVALPPLAHPPPVESLCALSGNPTVAGGCTVVLVEPPQSTVLWYCHAGAGEGSTWSRHEYDLGGTSIRVPGGPCWCKRIISDLASRHGRFYYFHSATEYGVIDFPPAASSPAFSTVPMRKVPMRYPAGQFMAIASMYTVEIDGELYTASVVHRGCHDVNSVDHVGVYRMDFARKKPVRVKSLGDRAILAGGGSGSFGGWCLATEFGLRPNTLYWMSPGDKRLHW